MLIVCLWPLGDEVRLEAMLSKQTNQSASFFDKKWYRLSVCLGYVSCVSVSAFFFFFFFFFHVFSPLAATVHVRYMNSSHIFWPVFREQYIRILFTDPQISFFINFFIKNGSHDTIYIFKNYFTTVILAISFQFQQNKFYPNRP